MLDENYTKKFIAENDIKRGKYKNVALRPQRTAEGIRLIYAKGILVLPYNVIISIFCDNAGHILIITSFGKVKIEGLNLVSLMQIFNDRSVEAIKEYEGNPEFVTAEDGEVVITKITPCHRMNDLFKADI
jgi:hypothetical protein